MEKMTAVFSLITVALLLLGGCSQGVEGEKEYVKMETSHGDMYFELYKDKAPTSVSNFLYYADKGFYDGTVFHRLVQEFVLQGGGFSSNGAQKPVSDPISNESGNGLKNEQFTLAMARTAKPNSATSQFYINIKHNSNLDPSEKNPGYAVFGKLIAGKKTLLEINDLGSRSINQYFRDFPNDLIIIEGVSRVDKASEEIKSQQDEDKEFMKTYAKKAEEREKKMNSLKEKAMSFYEDIKNGNSDNFTKTDSGLIYKKLKEGSGAKVFEGTLVTTHYTGWLTNGTMFDSSRERGQPAKFRTRGVIQGWAQALRLMKTGGHMLIYVSPRLGYGDRQMGEAIPPNSPLIFEMELLETQELVGNK